MMDAYAVGDGPLAGMRVVELATFVAAPLGGLTLAQMGADVVRIDPLGGAADHGRWPLDPDGTSLYWTGLNKMKRSVAFDLRSDEGRELAIALITAEGPEAGFFITNAVGRQWLDDGHLRGGRADLIHVQITGTRDGRPAVDYTVNARIGFPRSTGPAGWDAPVNHVLPAWDIATGLYCSTAMLAAERHRRRTGEGQHIRIALEDVATSVTGHLGYVGEALLHGRRRAPDGNYVYGTFGVDFACGDGERVMVVAITPRQWSALLEVTGTGDVVATLEGALGVDFMDEGARYEAREALAGVMRPWFASRTSKQVAEELGRTPVLWERYRSFDELGDELRDCLPAVLQGSGAGVQPLPFTPTDFEPAGQPQPRRASILGADTAAVLQERLGLSSSEISGLQDRKVIAGTHH